MYYVYLFASRRNGTLYCGETNALLKRVYEHKIKKGIGFTARYGVDKLVWYEMHELINNALTREKRIKCWRRAWKINLIEDMNPDWDDLYWKLGGTPPEDIIPAGMRSWEA